MPRCEYIKVYMIVTADKCELPLAVGESFIELADVTGLNVNTLRDSYAKQRRIRVTSKDALYIKLGRVISVKVPRDKKAPRHVFVWKGK